MKVLNIIQRYHPAIGGSESWCRNLCGFLVSKGVIVNVATINLYNMEEVFRNVPLEEQYFSLGRRDNEGGVSIRRYSLWKINSNLFSARLIRYFLYKVNLSKAQIGNIFINSPHSFEMYRNLSNEIKEVDIVILHTLPYFHNLIGYWIAKRYGKIIVSVPHFHPGHLQYERKIFFKMMNGCDAVITVSEYEKEYLIKRKVNRNKIFVTGNSVNEEVENSRELDNFKSKLFSEYKINEKSKRILFVGRKELYKGIDVLIKASQEIANEESNEVYLFLVGPDSPEFLSLFPNLANDSLVKIGKLKVINFGRVSDEEKNYLLEFSDVLALPSKFEAFGIVFLEAWKYKKPVIGSNLGAVPEVINGAGFCAEYGNVRDLKEKIQLVLNDEKLAQRLGEAGRKRLDEKYTIEKIGNNFLNICGSLKKHKKRVLFVSHLFPPYYIGGAEIVAYEQAKALKKNGFEIKVFTSKINDVKKRFGVEKEKNQFEMVSVNLHGKDFSHQDQLILEKKELLETFHEELYAFAPDAVHFHNIYAFSLEMIEECRKMHVPTIMTLHDFWGICAKNLLITNNNLLCDLKNTNCMHCEEGSYQIDGRAASLLQRNKTILRHFEMVDLLVSPSEYLMNKFIDRDIPKEKMRLIKYGIDLSRFKNIEKTKSCKIRFAYVGQIIEHKGIENLLKSFAVLKDEEKKRAFLLIVGPGDKIYVEYCKKLAEELKLENFVNFFGEMKNNKIKKLHKNIDVLIVPSIWPENSPVTILEALGAGTPVLASNIGGIPELVQDGVEGYLHKYDDPASLTQNIRRIIKQPEDLKKMKSACLRKAKENDLAVQVMTIAESYKQIIKNLNSLKNNYKDKL